MTPRRSPASLPCDLDLLPGDVADEHFWHDAAPSLGGLDYAVINAGVAGAGAIAELASRNGGAIVAVASAAGLKAEAWLAAARHICSLRA